MGWLSVARGVAYPAKPSTGATTALGGGGRMGSRTLSAAEVAGDRCDTCEPRRAHVTVYRGTLFIAETSTVPASQPTRGR